MATKTRSKKKAVATCGDLLAPIEEFVGCPHSMWPDGDFVNCTCDTAASGVLVTWMADVAALEEAIRSGCDTVLCHESVFYGEKRELPPYRWLAKGYSVTEPPWHPNSVRRGLIVGNKLGVVQCHYGLDRYPIYDAFRSDLGLASALHEEGWESVFALPKRMTLSELAGYCKRRLGIQDGVRVVGELDGTVGSVSLLWGGLGLDVNVYWMRRAKENGADAVIAGEISEYLATYAKEIAMPVVETSHRLSEEIGLQRYAGILQERFPKLKVVFHRAGRGYATV